MADISRIKLPSGNYYDIKDAVARQMIAGGISFVIAWNGSSTPVVANIPAGVVVKYNGTNYTGTLAASADTIGKFYLVKSTTQVETLDVYDEYATMQPTSSTYAWEKIGDTSIDLSSLKALAYKDNVTLYKGAGDMVLGESTTFTAGASNVSFGTHTTKKAIGSSATFTVTQPTVTVTPTTTNIKATASGTAVGANGTANAITGFGAHTTDSALGADATFTTTVTPATTNIKATASGAAVTPTVGTISCLTDTFSGNLVTTTVPNVTSVGTASTWRFVMGSGDDAETLIIGGDNSVAPTLGTAKTVATGSVAQDGTGSGVVTTAITDVYNVVTGITSVTQPTIALATGATAGTGVISVATGISSATTTANDKDTVTAITALGTPTTAAALTGVKVTSQPTIALATGATAGTGVISVATGISSASASGGAVAFNSKDEVTAITGLGAATAAAQTITVGSNDKVKVAKYDDIFGVDGVVVTTNEEPL